MQLPTDTIQRLAKVVPGVMLEEGDSRPALPPIFNIGIQIPFEFVAGVPDPLNRSASQNMDVDKPPSTGGSTLAGAFLEPGLWTVQIALATMADFTGGEFSITMIRVSDSFQTSIDSVRYHVANTEYKRERTFSFLIREQYFFRWNVPATGVAQNIYTRGAIHYTKWL